MITRERRGGRFLSNSGSSAAGTKVFLAVPSVPLLRLGAVYAALALPVRTRRTSRQLQEARPAPQQWKDHLLPPDLDGSIPLGAGRPPTSGWAGRGGEGSGPHAPAPRMTPVRPPLTAAGPRGSPGRGAGPRLDGVGTNTDRGGGRSRPGCGGRAGGCGGREAGGL